MGVIEIIREELRREALEKATEKGLEKGREEGLEKGLEKGMALKTISGVLKADQKGINHVDIAFLFDISVEEVEQILRNHKQ